MSTPTTLRLPDGVRRATIGTGRGGFAALQAVPAAGPCERRPALLIPGFTGSKEDFIPVLGPLAAAGRRVTAIDMRGQYESPRAGDPSGYRVPALAADAAAIVAALGGSDDVHLLGHSFGGLVAAELAAAQAVPAGSLTLMSSGPGALTGPRAQALEHVLARLRTVPPGGLAAEVRRVWDTMLEPEAAAAGAPPDVIAFMRTRMLRNSPVGLRTMAEDLLSWPDRTAALAAQPAPVLVVYGENDDAWTPAIQEEMARRLGAQRVCVPGAAHSPAVEAPETVASTLTAFWNAAEASRARRASLRPARPTAGG